MNGRLPEYGCREWAYAISVAFEASRIFGVRYRVTRRPVTPVGPLWFVAPAVES